MKKIINFLLCISLLSSCASGTTTERASTSAIGTYYEATEITEMKNTVTIAPDEKQMENLANGNDTVILEKEINAWGEAEVLTFKDFSCMKLTSGVGISTSWNTVYGFNKDTPEAISNVDGYKDGLFHNYYNPILEFAPYICCTDGTFRQLGIEEITCSDFCSHV